MKIKQKTVLLFCGILALVTLVLIFITLAKGNDFLISPLGSKIAQNPPQKPLDKYTIENLGNYQGVASKIKIERVISENELISTFLVSFISDNKKVTAVINSPKSQGSHGVIVMFRGYVDPENYTSGTGTQRAAEVFAQNGFITFAPDFLGYGGSDREAENIFESRFQTYTTALDAMSTAVNIDNADSEKVAIWGHSNGGQVALTVLEATGKPYPTAIWAPVTKPFPYSVLYYTDEAGDRGKFLRRELAKFELDYDADLYSITDYTNRIKAKIQLHQGSADEAVPKKWSDDFSKILEDNGVDITYYIYPGADHNLVPASFQRGEPAWNTVVARDIEFYRQDL